MYKNIFSLELQNQIKNYWKMLNYFRLLVLIIYIQIRIYALPFSARDKEIVLFE
jgi:hypothetical protein